MPWFLGKCLCTGGSSTLFVRVSYSKNESVEHSEALLCQKQPSQGVPKLSK